MRDGMREHDWVLCDGNGNGCIILLHDTWSGSISVRGVAAQTAHIGGS